MASIQVPPFPSQSVLTPCIQNPGTPAMAPMQVKPEEQSCPVMQGMPMVPLEHIPRVPLGIIHLKPVGQLSPDLQIPVRQMRALPGISCSLHTEPPDPRGIDRLGDRGEMSRKSCFPHRLRLCLDIWSTRCNRPDHQDGEYIFVPPRSRCTGPGRKSGSLHNHR